MAAVLSEEIWKNWDKNGKLEFIQVCTQFVKDENKSVLYNDEGKLTDIFKCVYELFGKGIKGILRKDAVISALQELVILHTDVACIILDVINIWDAATSPADSEESKDRSNFCALVKDCEKFLSDKLLKERLEIDTLQEVGVLKNNAFYSKFIKVKTKLYYKQRKFNLFREECEGFAKLLTELNCQFNDNTNAEELIGIVQSLIGCFNLDPNRVLDVILESFENKPKDAKVFIPLIKAYMSDPHIITEVLSTKFSFLRINQQEVPQSLYILVAQLLQHQLIKLDHIYHLLAPDDRTMVKDCEKNMKEAKEYVRKLQIISINSKDKEESVDDTENFCEKYVGNQKLGLCEALLIVGDWETAQTLIKRLPEYYAIGYEPIAMALCKLLHHIMEPLYSHLKIPRKPIKPLDTPLAPLPPHTFIELRSHAFPMLFTLGASLHYDPVLLTKVVRLCRASLSSCGVQKAKSPVPTGDSLYYDILSLLDTTILPALSYLDCNCCVAEEIWTLLKLYPYQMRYCLYSRWKNETYFHYPDLLRKRADSEKQIKNIMKRVSKENVKPVGRLIGKLTHCSPGFLFDYVLLQIQVYNNLITPVVDSLKYLTNLSYDVLGFCLIESLANAEKKRVKHDSTSISTWLQSLSSFCGAVYKKYTIELTGLLQFVANQLKAQKSLDLLILKEVVQKMAGVDAAEDLTVDQLNAMAGGELLKAEAGYFSQVRNTKKSSLRLKESMAENDLAVALCLLMAQQNYCAVYRETQKSHLKLVGKLSDQCQDTLVQFGTFLGSTFSVDEYINKLPSIQSMLTDYHIPTEVAFFLARPMFNHAINQKYDQLRKADPNYKKMSNTVKNQKYYEAVKEIMEPVHASLIPLHPPRVWEDISPQFLATFWSLTMYDLYVPEDTYQQVISKTKQQSLALLDSGTKGKKEQERYQTLFEKLQDEKKKQAEHVEKIMYRLKQEKDNWFFTTKIAKNETITRFLQLCIFPRCTFTQIDAVYCAKFVHTIHLLKTPNFATLLFYDRLFCDITYSVTSCTENEAQRYGRFLYTMLETVMKWHKSKEVFEKECANYPGFYTKYKKSNQHADNLDLVDYENYRHVCHKWHYKLAKAMVTCLESKDYIQIRNALIILIKIIAHFPVLVKLSQFIEKRIEKVRDEEKNNRQDLYTLSGSYLMVLKQRVNSGQMMKESDFHIPLEREKGAKNHELKTDGSTKHNGESKEEKSDKKSTKVNLEESRVVQKNPNTSGEINISNSKEKSEKSYKDESKEKYRMEKREEYDKEKEREKRREKKEEKLNNFKDERHERQYSRSQEERSVEMVSSKDDLRYSNERQPDRYHEERSGFYREREMRDERELPMSGNGNTTRHSQEPDPDRDIKRRKVDSSSKSAKHEERKQQQLQDFFVEKPEKKERSSKPKEKRDKLSEEEKELRKERKLGRKRDRLDEASQQELKRRRDEDKISKLISPNGEIIETSMYTREKHHRSREMSPYQRDRSSNEKSEPRDKQLEEVQRTKGDSYWSINSSIERPLIRK